LQKQLLLYYTVEEKANTDAYTDTYTYTNTDACTDT